MSTPFDTNAERYDRWFESQEGKTIFEIEISCLRETKWIMRGRRLEVGVGTGRFADSLGISEGIDPSSQMLAFAARRGIHAVRAVAEELPYPDSSFLGVVMVTTLCFLQDPIRAIEESFRVLEIHGSLLVGMVPGKSPWGKLYIAKGREGHTLYSHGKFRTCERMILMCKSIGFDLKDVVSGLLSAPGEPLISTTRCRIDENAGFVAMRFAKEALTTRVKQRL